MDWDDTTTNNASMEQNVLDNLLETMIDRDDAVSSRHAFLEAHNGNRSLSKVVDKVKAVIVETSLSKAEMKSAIQSCTPVFTRRQQMAGKTLKSN
ncbi:hypothetical protein P3S67_023001 [Capsicum chacoense]